MDKNLEIKTKLHSSVDGVIYFIGFILSISVFLKLNMNKILYNDITQVFNLFNGALITIISTFLFFSIDKLNIKSKIYIKLIRDKMTIYNGILRDYTIVYANKIDKIIEYDDKIVLILNNSEGININKKNFNISELKNFTKILTTYAPITYI